MGNEASTAMAVASAKANMNKTMDDINKSLEGTATKEDPGYKGVATKKESNQRRKDREREYELKKKERSQRKAKLSEKWEQNKKANEDKSEKKSSYWWWISPTGKRTDCKQLICGYSLSFTKYGRRFHNKS